MEKFTHNKIANLSAEKNRYHITEGNGFCLRVSPKGTKTWFYRYKFGGKEKWLTIGNFPVMGVAEARKAFNDLWEIRQSDQDPEEIIQKKLLQKNNNVKTLVSDWYNNYIVKHRKQPQQIKQQIDADIIPLLGTLEIEKIEPRDISKALDNIVQRGSPVHANKVLSTLKQAFNYAVSRGEITINPAINIRARDIGGLEKPRDRNLDLDEIKKIWLFLDGDEHSMSIQIKNAIKIILLTGARTGELRLAKWSEFNFDKSLWIIPPENNKIGLSMKIHLSELTKKLLLEIKEITLSNFVLAGIDDDAPLGDKSISKAIQRIQKRVGIPQWTAHDLRRTFATQLGETLRIDPVVIEKCLGHKMPKIMATYNKDEMLYQRKEALDKWGSLIEELTITKQ
ncbi:TPA: tyrosine-type recombinase/integrase [Legionella pneumophila]|uniref:tyrosine-type recombinase/integrase n=1 Tax=Legionella pneumophila TaxID=446 RepID=UPI0004901527|nr:site-specific integrase [Legionella pneumophila]RYB37965.1 site-specific integrase [Legionella pneumophila]RYW25681.1 site-specific integrase [Legionella pneumophila]HAT1868206.1 tyrosine-type recombinase/integrase [Legionella pneumophila]HAT1908333.1 tyrosine-type recombinase/integrase [Legionella pneumophila]HAT1917934.1 tyrosine-type recombinase/integrase [Legionella pneumophila]